MLFSLEKKKELLAKLADKNVVSDLGPYVGELLWSEYPQIKLAHALSFPQSTNTVEFCQKSSLTEFDDLLAEISFTGYKVASPGLGFTVPRVQVQIINEAFYALEENLATTTDMDQAMVSGLNYPEGPFKWCAEFGPSTVSLLLDNLHQTTGEPRYRQSVSLRLAAHKE